MEVLDPQALFEQLHPDDQRSLTIMLNKGGNPNNRLLEGMLVGEISKGVASFNAAQPHTPEEIRNICQRHLKAFWSTQAETDGPLSNDFLLGTAPGDSLETMKSHYKEMYSVSLVNANKTASLTQAISLIALAMEKEKKVRV